MGRPHQSPRTHTTLCFGFPPNGLLNLGDMAPVRSSLNVIPKETEHFITLAGILNVLLTFRGVGDSNDASTIKSNSI